ncbi:MAG: hypothetical protein K9K67_14855 [Bacteriovoracaceae bacterium]|nr:hypothetical protein [Bacteriovoracaceae bacterium]
MKSILRYLSLLTTSLFRALLQAITCFQLMLYSPLAFSQSQEAMTGQAQAPLTIDEQRAACTGASKKWDSELNSCITTPEAIAIKADAETCATAEDPSKCYMDEAQSKTGVNQGDKYKKNNLESTAQIVAAAYSLFSLGALMGVGDAASRHSIKDLSKGGRGNGKCVSKFIFWGTSIAWIAGDKFLKHRADKNFKDLAKGYESEANNEEQKAGDDGSYQAQVRAFTYLRNEQEQVKTQAKYRKLLQIAVVAGFAASLGFAIYELTPAGAPKRCTSVKGEVQQGPTQAGPTIEEARGSFKNQVFKLGTSAGLAVGSGIMLAINGYLIYHAAKEQSRAEDNIKQIDEVLETYSQYIAGFCPDGREDLKDDRCYCYNGDGTKNENRTNSVICQNLFAADSINYSLRNQTLKPLADGPRQGCITVTGQFDVDCKCSSMINNVTKQNACAKTPSSALLTGGLGAQLGAGQAMSSLGKFPQGANKAFANLNAASLNANAAKSQKLVDSMLGQAKSNGVTLPSKEDFEKMANELVLKEEKNQLKNNSLPSSGLLAANSSRPASMENALKKAETKAGISTSSLSLNGSTGAIGSNTKANGFKFNWNDAAAREGNKVQTFMNKKYDYKGSDIVKRDDVSLWNVISRRYQTSGLKRLFGEDDD